MKIDLFSIGKFTIHGYGLMIAIGILCCVAMASYRAKKNGLDQEAIVDIGIYGVIGGFLGAKILYVIVEFKTSRIRRRYSVQKGLSYMVELLPVF